MKNNGLLLVALVAIVAVVGLVILMNSANSAAVTYGQPGPSFCGPCPDGTIPRAFFMSGGYRLCSCVTPMDQRAELYNY